jgi:hypothetical protein
MCRPVTGGPAAVRITFLVVLGLCGGFSSAAVAGGIDPVGTVTGALSTIASQTTVASDLTGQTTVVTSQMSATSGATGVEATNAATGVVGAATSGGGGGGETSTSGDSGAREKSRSGETRRSSKGASARTRFDRLPRRYEVLLERIESGHRVRANIARLRSLLATATPRMRARILRLIRSEIRRLEHNGLTRRERVAARRLHRLLANLTAQPSPGAAAASSPATFPSEIVSDVAKRAGGVASEKAAGRQSPSTEGGPTLRIPGVPLPTPQPPSEGFHWLLTLLWAFAIASGAVAILRTAREFAARSPRNRG